MKTMFLTVGVLAALASSAAAGGLKVGSHTHAHGNANLGATVISGGQMANGWGYAQSNFDVKGHIHLHGSHGNHVHLKVDSSNSFGYASGFATGTVAGFTVISRSAFAYNTSASVVAVAQQSFSMGTVAGAYLVGPAFVNVWTQASGSFAAQLGVALTAVSAGGNATATVVTSIGAAGASSLTWGCVTTSAFLLAFHSTQISAGLTAMVDSVCPWNCSCGCGGTGMVGGALVVFAPTQIYGAISVSSWPYVYTSILANAALAGYSAIVIG